MTQRVSDRLWCGAAVIPTLLGLVLPAGSRGWLSAVLAVLTGLVAARRGIRAGPSRRAWSVLAGGLLCNATAEVLFTMWATQSSEGPLLWTAYGFYLVYYPVVGTGLWLLARQHGQERSSLIDTAMVAVGTSVVVWQFFVLPIAKDPDIGPLIRVVTVAFPAWDLVLLSLMARLAMGPRQPAVWLRLLTAGAATLFIADFSYVASDLYGGYTVGNYVNRFYLLAYGLLIVAALHPSATAPIPERRAGHGGVGWGRLALLTAATLVAPGVAMVSANEVQLPAIASAVLFLLVMARLAGLLRLVARSGERRFASLVASSTELIAVIDAGAVRYASPSMLRAAGVIGPGDDPNEVDAALVADFDLDRLVHPDDLDTLQALLADAAGRPPREPIEAEFRVRGPHGDWRTVAAVITNLTGDPDVGGVVLNARDIHELRQLASFDPLTGLANRARFTDALHAAIAARDTFDVLLLDLDGFKEINDSLGHHAGDAVLCAVARRLGELVEPSDVVARLGGDEFAILRGRTSSMTTAQLSDRALVLLRQPITIEGIAVTVGTSIGIAQRTADEDVAGEDLLRYADIALYRAKENGKARAVRYEAAMSEPVQRRLELRTELEHALAGEQMELHYQPLCDLQTGRTTGFEALLRWHHPTQGPIAPDEFIPAAEASHHIIVLGRWVLDQAVRQLARWQRAGPEWRELTMAVNLSPRQLHDPELARRIGRLLEENRVDPATLTLEITEQAVVEHHLTAVDTFRRLKRQGIRLAIDDYGSGNASISYLRTFPVDELKLDRTLVSPLDHGIAGPAGALVRSVVELAAALELYVVAEGIETDAQLRALRQLDAGRGQGYLLGRPCDARTATTRLTAERRGTSSLVEV